MSETRAAPAARADLVVAITGAASGIGASLARRLSRLGRRLLLHARPGADSHQRLLRVCAECKALGAPAVVTLQAELADMASAAKLIETTLAHFGAIDQLVANAGFARSAGVADTTWASMEQAFRVMPMSFAALLRHAEPHLRCSPCARVVAVSSFVAHRFDAALPFLETAAAKAALEAVAKSAAAEFAERGITVNCVVPGFTEKDRPSSNHAAWQRALEIMPSRRIATADSVAASIEFLLSPEAHHITGSLLHVDGGLLLL